jgi:hypothetical protein
MTQLHTDNIEITEIEWIDDCFRLEQKKWGTWESFDKNGKSIITALTEESCLNGTRFYLKGVQDGWKDCKSVSHEGTVGGKL